MHALVKKEEEELKKTLRGKKRRGEGRINVCVFPSPFTTQKERKGGRKGKIKGRKHGK